ncbi:CPBP family intramembrane glutamic endopeptidase [Halobacteriaceae archaeon GCM10025711]
MTATLGRVETLARSMTPWGFPVVYLGWAYLFWLPIFASDASIWTVPTVLFFLAGGASPLVAAVVLGYLTGGRERLYDLWRRVVDVRRISARWWGVLLGFWLAFDLLLAGAAVALGVTDAPIHVVWAVLTDPATLGLMVLFSFVLPAVEEVGLRGYYLDRLQERFSTTVAGVVNGATWAAWHTPFVWFPGYYANFTFHPELYWWLPNIVFTTLLLVWVYNGTDRSVLAVIVFHGMMNFTGEFLGIAAEMYPFVVSGYALAAALVVVAWRRPAARDGPTAA